MVEITGVEPRSKAEKAGIKAGEKLLKVGNYEINDLLDYRFYTTEGDITLTLESADGSRVEVVVD